MKIALTFAEFFAGAIALCLIGIGLGQALVVIARWMEKRGWKSPLAQTVPFVILVALLLAASGTWITMKGK